MSTNNDTLSSLKIREYLGDCEIPSPQIKSVTESTNKDAKLYAKKGCPEFLCVAADCQTAGRGRLGRSFFSPQSTGLYMSVVARPKINIEKSLFLTTAAAVCMCEAVNHCFGITPSVKWVNDLYMGEKKVCGILCESAVMPGDCLLDYAVVGIGINMYEPNGGFPDDIKNIAGAILPSPVIDGKNRLCAAFLAGFKAVCQQLDREDVRSSISERYKKLSNVLGKDIYIVNGAVRTLARVIDMDKECRLIVKDENGETRTLMSGEISIRVRD